MRPGRSEWGFVGEGRRRYRKVSKQREQFPGQYLRSYCARQMFAPDVHNAGPLTQNGEPVLRRTDVLPHAPE